MSSKTIARWAIVVLVVFVAAIVVFPMLYNPVEETTPANEPMPNLDLPATPVSE